MTDQDRITKLEQHVEMLLVMNTNKGEPLTQAEGEYVLEMKKRVGWRGWRIVDERLSMQVASAKHRELKQQLEVLEQDWPALKGQE